LFDEAVACPRKNIQGMKAELVFLFDETQIMEWEA
jgi:hypothetical protein